MKFSKHIFICTNERDNGKKSCGISHGMALVEEFKKHILYHKLHVEVRAQRAGCIDVCDFGPAIVVYPEGVFYGNVQIQDVEEIIQSHIIKNVPVDRLMLKF
ncbi:MAG: (2Fe-2S) ferredoxin domain-containing protein [Cytophagales bacterium]|nr:(2Fe-2S) ferredoxin domain-containing protein [Cytophagales bacterium]